LPQPRRVPLDMDGQSRIQIANQFQTFLMHLKRQHAATLPDQFVQIKTCLFECHGTGIKFGDIQHAVENVQQ
ncbi:MAG: hypothetical protein ABT940_15060, partial [Alphaproteobacteria bacterium]